MFHVTDQFSIVKPCKASKGTSPTRTGTSAPKFRSIGVGNDRMSEAPRNPWKSISKNISPFRKGMKSRGVFSSKWVFPKIGVPQNGWFIMENPIKMDDLVGKPTIFGNIQILTQLICQVNFRIGNPNPLKLVTSSPPTINTSTWAARISCGHGIGCGLNVQWSQIQKRKLTHPKIPE